jgi:hypothetical protein
MENKKRILNIGGAVCTALLVLTLLLSLLGVASAMPPAGNPWPGQRDLWAGSPVTQTAQYHSIDVMGANYLYVLYDTGLPSITGTVYITADRRWNGNTFATQTVTGSLTPGTEATGIITVASASPYYPSLRVGVSIGAGTIMPAIAVVGQ